MSGTSVSSLHSNEVLGLKPCVHCNRTFAPRVLVKHEAICGRGLKKRPTFDSAHQRLEAVRGQQDALLLAKKTSPLADNSTRKQVPAPPTAAAAGPSTSSSSTAPSRAAPGSAKRSCAQNVLESCPYCERTFGLKAIERHVAYCMQKSIAAAFAATRYNDETLNARRRMEARMKYKPPRPKVKQTTHSGSS